MKFTDEQLVEQIKAIGQRLIDYASTIVSKVENKCNIDIYISFNADSIPSINISTDFFPNALLNYFKNNY